MESISDRHAALVALARKCQRQGDDPEQILAALRDRSATIIECMKVMIDVMGLSLREAKRLVHFSNAWADLREAHEAVHQLATEALLEASSEMAAGEDGQLRLRVDLTTEDP